MTKRIYELVAAICLLTGVSNRYMKKVPSASIHNLRIIEGEDVKDYEYDYVVLIATIDGEETVYRKCTGSIIHSKWTLTAAHCVESYSKPGALDTMYVWYANFTKLPVQTKSCSKVLEIFLHPHYIYSYNNNKIDLNDIALVRMRSVAMPKYGKILATDYQALFGNKVTFVGGGQTTKSLTFGPTDDYKPLQYGQGVVMLCDRDFLDNMAFPLICVAPRCSKKRQTGYYGDAGGPLILDNRIIGVLVTMTPTAVTAYVPISPYLHWISGVVKRQRNTIYNYNNTRV